MQITPITRIFFFKVNKFPVIGIPGNIVGRRQNDLNTSIKYAASEAEAEPAAQ